MSENTDKGESSNDENRLPTLEDCSERTPSNVIDEERPDSEEWVGPLPSENANKRKFEDESTNLDSEKLVGPLPSEMAPSEPAKKRKILEHEQLYLNNLPSCESYEKSYMHRDVITHILCTKTDFIITASCDGHVKFWKKMDTDIEFVKHFRSHLSKQLNNSFNKFFDDKNLMPVFQHYY